jgi:hypothetical protein
MSFINRLPVEAQIVYQEMIDDGFDEEFIIESIKEMFDLENDDLDDVETL